MTAPYPCARCGQPFTPTAAGRRLALRGQPIYCNPSCADDPPSFRNLHRCHQCGTGFKIQQQGRALRDHLGKRTYCSVECLTDHMLREDLARLCPPLSPLPLLTVSQLPPKVRGLTPRPLTPQQCTLFTVLQQVTGAEWTLEYGVKTGRYQEGLPQHYSLDIACPEFKIAVECDGSGHNSRRIKDGVRDAVLGVLGWGVIRLRNEQIETHLESCVSLVVHAIEHRRRSQSFGSDHRGSGEGDAIVRRQE